MSRNNPSTVQLQPWVIQNTLRLEGQKFGQLTAIRPTYRRTQRMIKWECLCDCGNTTYVVGSKLKNGHTKSCGCRALRATNHRHGLSGTNIYSLWGGMMARCRDPSQGRYQGRGIVVCVGWHDPAKFAKEMGERPSKAYSLDRRDNDGNYSCGKCEECVANGWSMNVRWATQSEQARNTRHNHPVTAFGRTLLIIEWAELSGLRFGTLQSRIRNHGWPPEAAISLPVGSRLSQSGIQRCPTLLPTGTKASDVN